MRKPQLLADVLEIEVRSLAVVEDLNGVGALLVVITALAIALQLVSDQYIFGSQVSVVQIFRYRVLEYLKYFAHYQSSNIFAQLPLHAVLQNPLEDGNSLLGLGYYENALVIVVGLVAAAALHL